MDAETKYTETEAVFRGEAEHGFSASCRKTEGLHVGVEGYICLSSELARVKGESGCVEIQDMKELKLDLDIAAESGARAVCLDYPSPLVPLFMALILDSGFAHAHAETHPSLFILRINTHNGIPLTTYCRWRILRVGSTETVMAFQSLKA